MFWCELKEMSDYSSVKIGKLKLKGEKRYSFVYGFCLKLTFCPMLRKKKKQKSQKSDSAEETQKEIDLLDAQNHGLICFYLINIFII